MVADVSQFRVVRANELEDYSICLVYSEAPYFMVFWVKFFGPERGIERIIFKKFSSQSSFPLDISW